MVIEGNDDYEIKITTKTAIKPILELIRQSYAGFKECKATVLEKQIITGAVDLRNVRALEQLGDALRQNGAEITFANFTNVWEHTGSSIEETLPHLPFNKDAPILFSSRVYTDGGYPKMMGLCRGVG